MPPLVVPNLPVPGTVAIRIFGLLFGQQVINSIHVTRNDHAAPSQSEVVLLADYFSTTWAASVLPTLSQDYKYVKTVARSLHSLIDWQSKSSSGSSEGGNAAASEPGSVTIRVNYDAGVGGKSAHWGTQISGIIKANQNGNAVAVDWAASLVAGFGNFLTVGATVPGYDPSVVSRSAAGAVLTPPQTYQILQFNLNSYNIGSQDTRLNGHGS